MKISLTKSVQLYSATVYMKIEKKVKRTDIQEYLKGKQFNDRLINNRINDYLCKIGIYDESKQLTKLGNEVKETGFLPTPEEGKYRIWYTKNDDYFGNKIVYFRRERANEKSRIDNNNLPPLELDAHFSIPAKEKDLQNDFTEFVLRNRDLKGQIFNQTESITARLTIETDKQTYCSFNGNLGKDHSLTELDNKKQIKRDENIEVVIKDTMNDWNEETNRLKIRFAKEMGKSLDTFEIQNLQCKWKGFSGFIDSMKIMPYDLENAKQWRNYLLMEEIQKDYISSEDFNDLVALTNDNNGFASFYMDTPDIKQFKKNIDKNDKVAFWHLNAPMDLNPDNKFNINNRQAIVFQKDEQLSFDEIVERLNINANDYYDIVVYYDRYVGNYHQQKNVAEFMNSIISKKKIIITDMHTNYKCDYIEKNHKEIRMRDNNSNIFANKPLHDRTLIVKSNDGIKIWIISNSMDFISNNGKVRQNIVFAPIKENELDQELLNFVKKEEYNGKN